jgi:hypothetical protein
MGRPATWPHDGALGTHNEMAQFFVQSIVENQLTSSWQADALPLRHRKHGPAITAWLPGDAPHAIQARRGDG